MNGSELPRVFVWTVWVVLAPLTFIGLIAAGRYMGGQ